MIGNHLIVDLYDISPEKFNNNLLKDLMIQAAEKAGLTVVGFAEKVFEPQGYTCTVLLSESHISLHTYPEYGSLFLDIFSCGLKDPKIAFNHIISELKTTNYEIKHLTRGNLI